MKIKLKRAAGQRIRQGECLIQTQDIQSPEIGLLKEGESYPVHHADGAFLGHVLIGRQHKGLGWLYSRQPQQVWRESFVKGAIQGALERRQPLMHSDSTNAFRLFNAIGDGMGGITIDWYNGYGLINYYAEGLYQYRDWFHAALIESIPTLQGLYETKRFKTTSEGMAENNQHVYGQVAPSPHPIKENQVNYGVYLGEDWMTGIFLDQRHVRQFVKDQAAGRCVLNLFSYTAAFSVAATVGGASSTVSVDVAKRSMDRSMEQFELNVIEVDFDQHQIRVMDVFDYVKYALRHQLKFDLIICDPPSFARTKKIMWRVEDDYAALAEDLFKLLNPGGILITATNSAQYSADNFKAMLQEVVETTDGEAYLLTQFGLEADYPTSPDPESQYLKVLAYYREW